MKYKGLDEMIEAVSDEDNFVAFLLALAEDRAEEVKKEKDAPSSPYGPGP